MLYAKKSKKSAPQMSAKMGENEQVKSKEGGIPLSVKAALHSGKKVPSVVAKAGVPSFEPKAKSGENEQLSVKDPGHSKAYAERIKKRMNK